MAEKPGRLNLLSSQELNLTLTIQRRLNEGLSISLTLWREHLLVDQLQKKKKNSVKTCPNFFLMVGCPVASIAATSKLSRYPVEFAYIKSMSWVNLLMFFLWISLDTLPWMRWAWFRASCAWLARKSWLAFSCCPSSTSSSGFAGRIGAERRLRLSHFTAFVFFFCCNFKSWSSMVLVLLSTEKACFQLLFTKEKCRETWEKKRVSIIVRSVQVLPHINSVMKRFSSSVSLAPLVSMCSPKGKQKWFSNKFKSLGVFIFYFCPFSLLFI